MPSGLRVSGCLQVDGTDSAPVPESFGAVLDDEADRADLDLALPWLQPERRDDRGRAARSAPSALPVRSATDSANIACRSGEKDQGEIPVSAPAGALAIISARASAVLAREVSPARAAALASW